MIDTTEAIVLHHFKYSDTSIILHAYTRNYGRLSFMLQGVRKRNSRIKINLFQPLYILELEMYYKEKRQLQKVKEARNAYPYQSIPHDYRKTSMALFVAEMLYKCLREEEPNPELFAFISHHLRIFDLKKQGLANFHLYFMARLTKYLGFFPHNNFDATSAPYFDGKKGHFTAFPPKHHHHLEKEESALLSQLLSLSENQHEELEISRNRRIKILHALVNFYYLHIPGMGHINSFEILKDTFR